MKKLLIGLGTLVVLLAIAVAAAPFLVPTDTLRARLADQVRAATGRELRVSGPIRFTLLPAPAVRAEDVTFANAPDGKAPYLARLKSLALELRLRALLGGRIEVARLVLAEPEIALEVDARGRGNWVFDPPPAAPGTPAAEAAPRTASGQPDIHLDDVRLEGGKISWLDQRSGTGQVLDRIDLKLSLPGLAGPLAAAGTAMWNGEKVALSLTAGAPGALLAGKDSPVALALEAAPVKLKLDGTLTGLPPAKTTGTVDIAMPSLRRFAAWTGSPVALPGDALGPLSIKGRLTRAGDEVSFADADIALDGMRAHGALAVSTGGPRPLLKGRLELDRLDVNPYLPPAAPAAKGTGGPGPAAPAGWSDAPIDLSALKVADAELELTAGSIAWRDIRLDRTRLGLNLRGGKLAAQLRELAMYDGAGQGTLAVDASGAAPALDLSFTLAHVRIEPLLKAAAGMDRLAGTGTFNLAVTARGNSQRALIGSLDGKGALNLADGVVKGVNLPALAQALLPGGAREGGDSTTFGSLNGTFTLDRGILHNSDLLLKTRIAPVTGAGTVNLPARTLDYRATVQIAGTVRVPVQITGPLDNPSHRPELAGTVDQLRGVLGGDGSSGGSPASPGNLLRRLLPR